MNSTGEEGVRRRRTSEIDPWHEELVNFADLNKEKTPGDGELTKERTSDKDELTRGRETSVQR